MKKQFFYFPNSPTPNTATGRFFLVVKLKENKKGNTLHVACLLIIESLDKIEVGYFYNT